MGLAVVAQNGTVLKTQQVHTPVEANNQQQQEDSSSSNTGVIVGVVVAVVVACLGEH